MKPSGFYLEHLSRVSRSFAYCIERLPSPQREWIGLAYILCRLADTIEDSPWSTRQAQEKAFLDFMQFIERPIGSLEAVQTWTQSFPKDVPKGEQLLLQDANTFFSDLHELNEAQRLPIQERVLDMSRGMLHFSKQFIENGQFRLKTMEQTNQYCFFVAGVVGEMLTMLVMQDSLTNETLLKAYHFGFYLQKVNLLKDYWTDIREGRFLVPDVARTRSQVNQHARFALSYLEAIPQSLREYRLFCAWSLFLGLGSLKWIDRSREGKIVKIPRLEALAIFNRIEQKIDSPAALRGEFEHYLPGLEPKKASVATIDLKSKPWFTGIYTGQLSLSAMAELGMMDV